MVSLRWGNMFGIDRKWSNIIARLKNLNQCLWLRVKPKSNFYNEHIICSSNHYYIPCLMWKVKIILYLNTSNFKEVLIILSVKTESKKCLVLYTTNWCYSTSTFLAGCWWLEYWSCKNDMLIYDTHIQYFWFFIKKFTSAYIFLKKDKIYSDTFFTHTHTTCCTVLEN